MYVYCIKSFNTTANREEMKQDILRKVLFRDVYPD